MGIETVDSESRAWEIGLYNSSMKEKWNGFVDKSVNSTFLFNRDYMDYHSDRFRDCSLMAWKKGELRALLPADMTPDRELRSHGGLTYGGWIIPSSHFDANDMMALWEIWMEWCRTQNIKKIDYKPVPWIYTRRPAQEDLYAIFRFGGVMTECNLSSTIDLQNPRPFNTQQKRNLKRGMKQDCKIETDIPVSEFHVLLSSCLEERHGVKPVHNLEELNLLCNRFPENIRLFGLRDADGFQAGVCMFECGVTAHCQYIASTPKGRSEGLLTRLFSYLIEYYASQSYRYFDFGISNEAHGRILNAGLLRQKASLGGSGVAYMRFSIPVS